MVCAYLGSKMKKKGRERTAPSYIANEMHVPPLLVSVLQEEANGRREGGRTWHFLFSCAIAHVRVPIAVQLREKGFLSQGFYEVQNDK